jgi:hypothetical protein
MYAMNNTTILDHEGLFIYINFNYLEFYNDVNIFQHSSIYHNGGNISFMTMSTLSSYLGVPGIWEKKCS